MQGSASFSLRLKVCDTYVLQEKIQNWISIVFALNMANLAAAMVVAIISSEISQKLQFFKPK